MIYYTSVYMYYYVQYYFQNHKSTVLHLGMATLY